jgi:Heparinase II/III-like protein/Heparinase II/III N-terminus
MSGAGWALRRLSAMPPGEILHRARVALRDRFAPAAWARLAPEEAYTRLFTTDVASTLEQSHLDALVHVVPGAGDAAVTAAAESLARGEWTLFGHAVRLDDPPRWNRNPLTGAAWPEAAAAGLDYHRTDLAGGAKYTWELGRLTSLPVLALASRVGGGPAHAARARAWLDDWNAHQPLGRGIHSTSGIEMAIRVLTVTWTLALLDPANRAATARASLGLLAQQAFWCRDHLSLGSSANNHLLAELSAMTVMGATFPTLRDARVLAQTGLEGLEREVARQIHADGIPAEQAFGYLPFIWELLLSAALAAEAAGLGVPAVLRQRLAASLEFARVVRRPGGFLPQVGDEDDGCILLALEETSRLDRVGNAVAAWLGEDALSDDEALARLLTGRARPARAAGDGSHDFSAGGWSVWRGQGLLVTFDHAPLGLDPLAAHGHADALGITIFRGGDAIVVDPGTFAYHEDPTARERFRGTPAHSTVRFGARSQSESLGPFLWGRRELVTRANEGWSCRWWSGELHTRRVEVAGGRIHLEDRVSGAGAEIVFALAPEASVSLEGAHAVVLSGGSSALFSATGLGPWRLEAGEHSPRFGWKVPAQRLVAAIKGPRARTTITLGDAADAPPRP